ncbi:MAG: hypothetical protein COT74_13700 [Bdellovibrionales bacterium CG10_big_fil_rev_8_21_14_0_10_45_34]|nr:MAG: hypothetical protein COT74_13700 [Bdellovibrionales bacterium CG10_big_fil_rev_8_21_14_0_10_45_34]
MIFFCQNFLILLARSIFSLTLVGSLLSCGLDQDENGAPPAPAVAAPVPTPVPEAPAEVTVDCMASGDIVVSNSGSDTVVVLNPDGTYKGVAYNLVNGVEAPYGLVWIPETKELVVAVDGVDRLQVVDGTDCTNLPFVQNPNLNGNLRGLTRLTSGDFLVVESNAIERFSSSGFRVTNGGWPKNLQTTGTALDARSDGGFILCSTGGDVVRTYSSDGTQTGTRSSGIAGTTDAAACKVLADGSILVAWSGTTDTVAKYSSDLSTLIWSYSDIGILAAPGGLAERADGRILVIDRIHNYVIELTSEGAFSNAIADTILSTPEFLIVIP